jgi:hypothetical protein
VSKWTFDAGLPTPASTAKGYAYTPSGANWFKQRNRWGTSPRKGAHVFFQFSGPRIHHVGLVTSNDGVLPIQTIEANTSRGTSGSQRDGGGVWRRSRASGIVGYGYPDYSESEEEDWMTSKEVEKLLLEMNHEIRTVIPARFNAIEGLMNNTFRELVQKGDGTIRTELDGLRVDMRSIGGKLGFTPKS